MGCMAETREACRGAGAAALTTLRGGCATESCERPGSGGGARARRLALHAVTADSTASGPSRRTGDVLVPLPVGRRPGVAAAPPVLERGAQVRLGGGPPPALDDRGGALRAVQR
eukprot:CAMPEP_0179278900 /NCGR_PEP_ID=MMETSP0797-20121207/35840_1 /TAXON_ID=47934 /ORGANISM="Dinophysis acuminata, Strain DAEP01" /LENGTH=113 /DNA_ID=CAMNT_0020987519 /DNA_START=215 /DNA_END=551 /DNA_ORIENTATION=-